MITVVKIGGEVVDTPSALPGFISRFSALPGPKVLVHGGGKEATRLSERLEVPTVMIEGRRVTSAETIDIVTMVYAGLVNKRLVAMLQAAGCDAIGLSGADADAIRTARRPPCPVDYGFVGDPSPEGVNTRLISHLASSGLVPVFCAITHDGTGALLNTNADSVASTVARALARIDSVKLIYCFEHPGVMADISDPASLMPALSEADFPDLKARGIVSKGMIPKLNNAFAALRDGVESVMIQQASALGTDTGTAITI